MAEATRTSMHRKSQYDFLAPQWQGKLVAWDFLLAAGLAFWSSLQISPRDRLRGECSAFGDASSHRYWCSKDSVICRVNYHNQPQ